MKIDLREQLVRDDEYLYEALEISEDELQQVVVRGLKQYPTPGDLLNALALEPEKVNTVIQQELANRTETITHIAAKILLTKYEKVSIEQFVLFWGLVKDFLNDLERRQHNCEECPARVICPAGKHSEERLKEEKPSYIY